MLREYVFGAAYFMNSPACKTIAIAENGVEPFSYPLHSSTKHEHFYWSLFFPNEHKKKTTIGQSAIQP